MEEIVTSLSEIPANFWLIMGLSHMLHIWTKLELNPENNMSLFLKDIRNPRKIIATVMGVIQSVTLLIMLHDSYGRYIEVNGDKYQWVASIVVAFIGYSGSSIWNNVMNLLQKVFTKKINEIGDDIP